MKQFDFNRFGQALKCHFMVGRRTWIRLFGIYTLVMFMAGLFFTRLSFRGYTELEATMGEAGVFAVYRNAVYQTSLFGFIFFCFAMLFGASYLFNHMKTTPQRSAYLTWPVSNLEKYVIAFLHNVVLMAVITVVAYVLADALRVLVDWLTGRVIIWGRMSFNTASSPADEDWRLVWMAVTWPCYIHSLYILGGTLFRRQQFLLTSITISVVSILLTIILNQIDWSGVHIDFITGYWDEKTNTYIKTFHPLFYIVNIVGCLLIIFHYWASYKLFTRMQVINNKWLNV